MKRVFIAGPFRGKTPYDVHRNVIEAESFILPIAQIGACPVCPHTMTQHFDHTMTDDFWLEATSCLLEACDALIATDRWYESDGAMNEVEKMQRMGRRTFFGIDGLSELAKYVKDM